MGGRYLLSHNTRWRIARACSTEDLTTYSLGKQLDRAPGSLENVVAGMVHNGILKRVKTPSGSAAYRLTSKGSKELKRLESERPAPGLITEGQRLLAVALTNLPSQRDAIESAAGDPAVLWAVRIDGSYRYLIAVAEQSSEVADRLEGVFTAAGAQCAYGRADAVLTPKELARHVAEARNPPQLGVDSSES